MHCGAHAGQVAVVLPTSVLQKYVFDFKSKRALNGLLRRSRTQLILEYTDKYDDSEGRPLTVAELVEKHQQMEEKFDDERSTLATKVLLAQDCA
eukprot:2579263-Pleurochrysis_carterae.AAC.1